MWALLIDAFVGHVFCLIGGEGYRQPPLQVGHDAREGVIVGARSAAPRPLVATSTSDEKPDPA
jgi:hypothetical protein